MSSSATGAFSVSPALIDIKNFDVMMSNVRTTLTLDDELADKLKALAERERKPFRQVVNEVVRRGLQSKGSRSQAAPFELSPFRSAFRPGVDPMKLNQLVDELEARAALERER